MITTDVENYPGFIDAITGPELMERFEKQAARFNAVIHKENVLELDVKSSPFKIRGETQTVEARTVILATGASAKWLGIKGEEEFQNKGVSACATCDGFFFRGQHVIVVGGGDTAMEEATYLAKLCESVTVIHRRHELRASKIMQERALNNPKLRFIWDSAVNEIVGNDKGVTGARVKNLKTGKESTVEATGFFVAIGHQPTTELFKDKLKLQPNGYLWVEPGTCRTSVEGIFGAGDVADATYRQAVTAAGMGCMAALEAQRYLTEQGFS